MGFPKQEYWSGLPCPSPGDLPDPGIESTSLMSPELAGGFLPLVLPGKPSDIVCVVLCLVAQLCLTFYDPWMAAHQAPATGVLQARILE